MKFRSDLAKRFEILFVATPLGNVIRNYPQLVPHIPADREGRHDTADNHSESDKKRAFD
jgi:hypothetical protein